MHEKGCKKLDRKLLCVPKRKGTKRKHRHLLTKWKPSHSFWQVSLDIMGPFPESQGNKYILLIGDQFSKWHEAVALSNQEAKTGSRVFVEHWMVRFDCTVNLHSDPGSNWCQNCLVVFALS